MKPRDVLWLGIGALVSPFAQLLAAKYAGRHWLDLIQKEQSCPL